MSRRASSARTSFVAGAVTSGSTGGAGGTEVEKGRVLVLVLAFFLVLALLFCGMVGGGFWRLASEADLPVIEDGHIIFQRCD
jgi:hypothetical protein